MSQEPSRPIPRPRLREVRNLTPFVHFQCDKMGPGRLFFDTVVVKGTFDLVPSKVTRAEEQDPVVLADEPFESDEDTRSSLRRCGELLLGKPGTDVYVTGTARAPGGAPTRAWNTAVELIGGNGTKLRYDLQASGPRVWRHRRLLGWELSDPEPTTEVAIRYELAYGGAYRYPSASPEEERWRLYEPNPSGRGFIYEQTLDRERTYAAPQWQSPSQPVTAMNAHVPLAGFGPVPRPWSSRLQYGGTYDQAWMVRAKEDSAMGLPVDYPDDFDFRFFQCAHPELIAPKHLVGNEIMTLAGLAADHAEIATRLPGIEVKARLFRPQLVCLETTLPLDTVHLDMDRSLVHLTWRLTLDQQFGVVAALLFSKELP